MWRSIVYVLGNVRCARFFPFLKKDVEHVLGNKMIPELEQKYQQLTEAQKEIFRGYGLRQVKHFVEFSLPKIEATLPQQGKVLGINAEGKVQALNTETQEVYLWISDQQWQAAKSVSQHVDAKEDFLAVWQIFDLEHQDLISLSHIHRDFLAAQSSSSY